TPTLRCNQRCLFCWRSMEHELETETEPLPEEIVAAIPALQRKGLSGDKPFSDQAFWEEATTHPTQYAISLSGEPTLYSRLPELIALLKQGPNSVFVVSNGTNPAMIRKIHPTQLYLSLDAGNPEEYNRICRPMGNPETMWNNILESLSLLEEKEREGVRTAVRTTLVRGLNDTPEDAYALGNLIKDAHPLFVEIKGYMYLGFSRQRLSEDAVPTMDEIRKFAEEVASASGYRFMDENEPSRVVVYKRT
ncbi:MAG TPA: radical SAM protein, partial [Methanocorpusculum sp.]|nr:radical SAM protein [Methanocorpusculum sp.]